jgi:hypothetical protein
MTLKRMNTSFLIPFRNFAAPQALSHYPAPASAKVLKALKHPRNRFALSQKRNRSFSSRAIKRALSDSIVTVCVSAATLQNFFYSHGFIPP